MSDFASADLHVQGAPWSDDTVMLAVSNAPDLLLAKRIAHMLVEEHLAACVNLGAPSLSMYMWDGVLEGADEVPLFIKTTAGRLPALYRRLVALHPYDVPEFLFWPAAGGSAAYLDWVREQAQRGVVDAGHDASGVAGA